MDTVTVARRLRTLRHPRRAASAVLTRAQAQRILGFEPPEFRRLAREVLYTGRIDGWRYRQDLALLYLLARDVPGPGVTVEVGSFKGLATVALATGVRHGGHEPVHTVDPHTGDRQDLEARGLEALPSEQEFRRNIREAGVDHLVTGYTMTSDELAACWPGHPVRVLFIDGWHGYDAVASDIRNWVPLLTADGVVVVDDYRNYDEVRAAVDDAGDVLPPHRRPAGRMRLAHRAPLPPQVERFLHIPWG
ncbi:MAG: class I SAM-dependent methyltransferase [Acidimicrobiales bacterium]